MLASHHDLAASVLNSWWVLLLTQPGAHQHPVLGVEMVSESPPLLRICKQIMVDEKGKDIFLSGVVSDSWPWSCKEIFSYAL